MPNFAGNLYIDEALPDAHAVLKMVRRFGEGKRVPFRVIYFLCVNAKGKFNVEIMRFYEIFKALHAGRDYVVIGVAVSREGAFELLRRIASDFVAEDYMVYGDFSRLKEYILMKTEGNI